MYHLHLQCNESCAEKIWIRGFFYNYTHRWFLARKIIILYSNIAALILCLIAYLNMPRKYVQWPTQSPCIYFIIDCLYFFLHICRFIPLNRNPIAIVLDKAIIFWYLIVLGRIISGLYSTKLFVFKLHFRAVLQSNNKICEDMSNKLGPITFYFWQWS